VIHTTLLRVFVGSKKVELGHKLVCCNLQCPDLEYLKGARSAGTITILLVENRSSIYFSVRNQFCLHFTLHGFYK